MLILNYTIPLSGIRRGAFPWKIDKVEFAQLEEGKPEPDDALVNACHAAMRTEDGKKVPVETLRTYDLREGLAAAFRAIFTTPTHNESENVL